MGAWFHELWLFVYAVLAHWQALATGGLVTAVVGIYERKKNQLSWQSYVFIVAAFVLYSFFAAWQDEHRNTQTVIADKSALSGERNACSADLRIEQAFSKGLQGQNGDSRTTIDREGITLNQQQQTINSCVVSLGKMNPLVDRRIRAIAPLVAAVRSGPSGPTNLFEIVIMTNYTAEPDGTLTCDLPSRLISEPKLTPSGHIVVLMSSPVDSDFSKTHKIKVNGMGETWSDGNPIYVTAVAPTSESSLGKCSFSLENPK